jgi:hypothetical protein
MKKVREDKTRTGEKTNTVDGLTGEVMICTRSIDITDCCPSRQNDKKKKVIVDYMQGTDGISFHLFSGLGVRNTLEDLEDLESRTTAVFCRFSETLGFNHPQDLREIIKKHAPKLDRKQLLADLRKAFSICGKSDGLLLDRMEHFGVGFKEVR